MSKTEVADLIERFLEMRSAYPQEWNDFVDTSQDDTQIDEFRQRCHELDPLVNRPGVPDDAAIAELSAMVSKLRAIKH